MTLAGLHRLIVIIGLVLMTTDALAQDHYPDRPIKIVVPFPAGGAPDTLARILSEKLASKWGKPIVVENRPGATGNIGAEAAARAEPDGYTLIFSPPPPFVINQHLFPDLRFDPSAFIPISVMAEVPNVLVTRSGLPAGNLQELIALAKAQPGKLTYGSTGKGGTPHLSAEMLKTLAGVSILHVPYKNSPQVLNDMLGGSVDLTFANLIDTLPLIAAGKLKALGVGGAERSPYLPAVPALSEAMPGFISTTWFALAAPPKTPTGIVRKLAAAVVETLSQPDATARLQMLKATPILSTPSEAAAFFADESERWRKVIIAAGVRQE
jgi:tripartite-type tricarboxylate transporter receptor subunit TctC